MNISQNSAFHKRINNTIQSISAKMLARNEELTDDENAILSTTSFPVLAILRTYQKYHAGGVNSMISDSQIISQFNKKLREHELEMINFSKNIPYPVTN